MKIRFTISRKLWLGFGVLIFAILVNGFFTFLTLNRGKRLNDKIANIYTPAISALKDVKLLVVHSKTLIINWLEDDKVDTPSKNELMHIHDHDYVELKRNLKIVLDRFDIYLDEVRINEIFDEIDQVMVIQKELMNTYQNESDYWYPVERIDERMSVQKNFIGGQLDKKIKKILTDLDEFIAMQGEKSTKSSIAMQQAFDVLQWYIVVFGIILLLGGVLISYFTIRSIVFPVRNLRKVLTIMGKGVLPDQNISGRNDEIGEMSMALDHLVKGLRATSNFAKKIGEGDFDAEFLPLSEKDMLGNSLLVMRNSLATLDEEGKKRSWSTEGLANFSEILRKHSDDVTKLSEYLISELIEYMGANQGGVFVLNDDNANDVYLELAGCYAWERLKYIEQHVYLGDGLVGQSWQEKSILYITDVPEDYIRITSGLGSASPSCILIVPMIVNGEVYGVIELAFFEEVEDYKIKFVERLAETVASAISAVKINERTRTLLETSQLASEQMRIKEMQLRENQGAMEIIQRDMENKLEEMERKLAEMTASESQLKEENEILKNVVLKTTKELDRYREV